MLALITSFLTFVLLLNFLPLANYFTSEARIYNLIDYQEAKQVAIRDKTKDFLVEKFPQLHLEVVSADFSVEEPKLKDLPRKKENFNQLELGNIKGVVWDKENQAFLYENQAEEQVSIASLTKLMTALVFLEHNPGWDKVYEISRADRREGGRIYLYLGDRLSIKDLFTTSLVASANTATLALVHSTGMTEQEFVAKMNQKASQIGLVKTSFTDVSGLNSSNVSTAKELARLVEVALEKHEISQATSKKEYRFLTEQGQVKEIETTISLWQEFPHNGIDALGGKTGYTSEAGYCFVAKFKNIRNQKELISVILGAETRESRFTKTLELINWTYASYTW